MYPPSQNATADLREADDVTGGAGVGADPAVAFDYEVRGKGGEQAFAR